ncbi:MAG: protein kinase [Planctomycetota bacterium]|nr:protein kinase [Planctomycetota bacterium]
MAEQRVFTGSLKPGVKLGKYEIREQVGTGGMAVLYKAHDPMLDRFVAVKQIAPHLAQDERFVERFRTEAQTLAKLSSSQANIVSVYELIQQDGQLFLVMEYVEGTTLRAIMDRGPVPLQTALGVLLSTALGLKAMHSQGIVHRDLTPANIMMAKDGALKITDFGLIGHSGGKTSLPMGTTKYMAPEMFTGVPVDARADLYGLGMIAYEMLVGPEKFAEAFKDVLRDEKAQQVRWMHWHSNPTMRPPALRDLQPGVPPLVGKIIERMMDKDPSKRFASADQIIRWLRRIFVMHVQGKSISATDSESMEKEIDAEAAAPAATAVVPAGRPGAAATAAGAVVPAAGQAPVEKTAPLPQPKWTWKQAALIAAIVLVTCGGVLAFFVIRERSQRLDLERAADQRWMLGRQQFDNKEYDAAYKTLTRMAQDFAQLQNRASQAQEFAQRAKAEDALSRKDYEVADPACVAAEKLGAPALWVSDFRTRMLKYQDIDQAMKTAELSQQAGDFQKAITQLTDLQAKYPDLKLTDNIIALREKLELRELNRLIAQGKQLFERGSLATALDTLQAAEKIRSTPEIKDLIKKVTSRMQLVQLYAAAEKAVAAAKWDEAARCYDEIYKLDPSPPIREKANLARAEALAIQARALEQNGLSAQAAPIWDKVLGFNPKHTEAIQATQKRNRQQKIDGFMKAGNDAMAAKQWDQAINSFNDVKTLLDATDTALKTKIDGFVAECSYQKAMDAGRAALARDDFPEAERQAGIANGLKSTDEAKAFQARIDTRRQYKGFFDTATELSKQFNYVQARSAALKAQKVEDTPEVRALIIEVDYYRYKAQGDMLQEQEKLIEALNFYRIAQRAKDTVEIQAKLDLLTKKIEAQKAKDQSKG